MSWLMLAALAATFLISFALGVNMRRYIRNVEAHWPPEGRFIDIADLRVHVRETGETHAPRVLLVHGASANLRELWHPLADALAADHRVIAYDRPGMGYTSRPRRNGHALAYQAQIAARVLEEAGGEPAIIVAHSLGASIALRLALDHPRLVAGLVLIAPASHPYPGRNAWWAELAAAPLMGDIFCDLLVPWLGPVMGKAGIANNFAPAQTPQNYYEDAGVGLIFRPRAFRASALDVCATKREFAAQAPRYGEIIAPAVIVTADKERVVSPQIHARPLAAELSAELVIAPDTGHMPHRLRTDLVIAAIRRVEGMAAAA
jgi:pimeloyl-ACP methyl ester carboxylesterase